MDSANLALALDSDPDELASPAALLRGTARGLEIVVYARASAEAMVEALAARLDEAPGFFRGSDVRVSVEDGPLAAGCLARLDELAEAFGLRIIEVAASRPKARERDGVPCANLAAGSARGQSPGGEFAEEGPTLAAPAAPQASPQPVALPTSQPVMLAESELTVALEFAETEISFDEPTQTAAPRQLAPSPEVALETLGEGPRLVIGPVRSGVILEHVGHVIVFGDVNPGAEVRASGNIVVLGRLRGTAHAGIGQDTGFILALRLEPQQLRIARMVARAGDSDAPATDAEIAYINPRVKDPSGPASEPDGSAQIVVERYLGKLPRNLATSL